MNDNNNTYAYCIQQYMSLHCDNMGIVSTLRTMSVHIKKAKIFQKQPFDKSIFQPKSLLFESQSAVGWGKEKENLVQYRPNYVNG